MSYSFWETVRGHALADVLTRELPELNEKNNKQFEELSDILSGIHQLDTGNRHLEECNTWNDRYWGTVNGKGENNLGKILMRIRDELRK